jgi:ABC-2 type transport system ATP-binding protein
MPHVPIISVHHLGKDYRQVKRAEGRFGALRTLFTRQAITRTAVDDVSFSIEPGEAVGYIGPNGAGKSTTIKMLTGILVPSRGEVGVLGVAPHRHRRRNARRIGVVFGQRSQLWWDLPVAESFALHRHMYDIPPERYRQMRDLCADLLGLGDLLATPVRQLSLGQRMRCELAMALLHEPELLFLDEPTIGLDIEAKDRIRVFLRTINRERATTVILTTHDLADIEETCPRIIVINRGRLVYDGTIQALKAQVGGQRQVTIDFVEDPGPVALPQATLIADHGRRKTYAVERSVESTLGVLTTVAAAHPVQDVAFAEPAIEDVIRALYAGLGEPAPESDEIDRWSRGRVVTQ